MSCPSKLGTHDNGVTRILTNFFVWANFSPKGRGRGGNPPGYATNS